MPMIIGGDVWWWWWWWQWRSARSLMTIVTNGRRKFRSQNCDNMDRSKSRGGERQSREGEKEEDQTRERVGRKKMQAREKIRKVAKHCVFPIFCGSGERKVGSLKRRARKHLGRWEMKNCTPLWHEAHLEVKMYKARHCRSTFGSWDVEKAHAVVARSIFRSQNVQRTSFSENFCKLRCSKSARRCGEVNFEAKMYKARHSRSTFGSWDVPKVQAVVAQAHYAHLVRSVKNWRSRGTFWS